MTRPGRPREFDEAEVLDAALQLFWAQGYERTGIADVVAATGVLRGSLYAAFGDKRGLFLAALARYRARWTASLAALETGPALPGLRAMLLHLAGASHEAGGRGCLIGNTIGEAFLGEEVVREAVQATLDEVAARVAAVLRRGQAAGEVTRLRAPEAQAWLILAVLEGLLLLGRAGRPDGQLEAMVDTALDGLRAQPAP
ncbi:MAG: TetR/AcrR family transcriptional regulator [Roseococcus sp.]|nr:TetR/AcrR family transcriptional regulator [Roseococcus sp.]